MLFDDFSGYAEGFGDTPAEAARDVIKNCAQEATDTLSGAEKVFVKSKSCSFSISSIK